MKINAIINTKIYLKEIQDFSLEDGSCRVWHKDRLITVECQDIMGVAEHMGYNKHYQYIKVLSLNKQIYKLKNEVETLKKIKKSTPTLAQLRKINPMLRFVIICENDKFSFIFENSDTSSGSHAGLSDDCERVYKKGYPVSGGFYIHNLHNGKIDKLKVILYGESSHFRRATEKELQEAIKQYHSSRTKDSREVEFIIKPTDWDMSDILK